MKVVDLDYMDTYDLKLIAGTWLTEANKQNRFNEFIANETFIKELGREPPPLPNSKPNSKPDSRSEPRTWRAASFSFFSLLPCARTLGQGRIGPLGSLLDLFEKI